jgi:hypothetical protein
VITSGFILEIQLKFGVSRTKVLGQCASANISFDVLVFDLPPCLPYRTALIWRHGGRQVDGVARAQPVLARL